MNFFKLIIATMLMFSQLFASGNYDIAIELARSNKVDKTIKNINEIVELTNSYILKTGDLTVTKEKLENYFKTSKMLWKNPDDKNINFTYDTNLKKIVLSNILVSNASDLQKRFLTNSTNLPKNSYLEEKDNFTLTVPLSSITTKFVELVESVGNLKQGNIEYKPDGEGGLKVFKNGKEFGKVDIDDKHAVTASSITELSNIKARKGSIGYVINSKNEAVKYIYNGTKWISLVGEGGIKTTSICNAKTLGALRYSEEKSCSAFCSYNKGTYEWRCYNNNKPQAPIITDITNTKNNIKIIGTALKGSSVILYDNNKELNTTKSDQNGSFSLNLASNLSTGTHSITAKSILKGKESQISKPYKIIIGDDSDETITLDDDTYYMDGKNGTNKVKVNGKYADYTIEKVEDGLYSITNKDGKKVILKNFEGIIFDDKEIDFGIAYIEVDDDLYYYL